MPVCVVHHREKLPLTLSFGAESCYPFVKNAAYNIPKMGCLVIHCFSWFNPLGTRCGFAGRQNHSQTFAFGYFFFKVGKGFVIRK